MYYDETNEVVANFAKISGTVVDDPVVSHMVEDEKFYEFKVAVERLSKIKDIIPVTVSERAIFNPMKKGDFVEVEGEYRSYNKLFNDRSRLVLHLFAKDVAILEEAKENINEVKLVGFLCKEPVYRKTPLDREICDILIAVNRPNFHKSDYVPCILWGRNARFVANQNIGSKIEIVGRIQSREYTKQHPNGETENKTAYEVSCQRVSLVANLKGFVKDDEEAGKVVF